MEFADGKILAEIKDGVGRITFNQPEKRNAMSVTMWGGMGAALDTGMPKPRGEFLERRQQHRFLDLDLPETCLQGDASDPLGFARFGLPELILQFYDLFPDLRRWFLHSGWAFRIWSFWSSSRIPRMRAMGD